MTKTLNEEWHKMPCIGKNQQTDGQSWNGTLPRKTRVGDACFTNLVCNRGEWTCAKCNVGRGTRGINVNPGGVPTFCLESTKKSLARTTESS